jgi:hypothetical protein
MTETLILRTRPTTVEAKRLTEDNREEIARWVGGWTYGMLHVRWLDKDTQHVVVGRRRRLDRQDRVRPLQAGQRRRDLLAVRPGHPGGVGVNDTQEAAGEATAVTVLREMDKLPSEF